MMSKASLHSELLVDDHWLQAHLECTDLVVLDATTHTTPAPPQPYGIVSGYADFERGHIPGAQFVDLATELSAPQPPAVLPFTLPSAEDFAATMARLGIADSTHVVCYSSANHWWATRLWWMLGVYGHDRAAVLDGGLQQWVAAGRPLETGAGRSRPRALFTPHYRAERVADRHDVLAAIGDAGTCLLNALPAESHRGEGGTDYGRPGHIAGSINIPAVELVDEHNLFKPARELARLLAPALATSGIIASCGGGVSATSPSFALALLGRPDARVYTGSLAEWAADPALPMAVGA